MELRRVQAADWRALRDVRLRALADTPDAYGTTYEQDAARGDAFWQQRAADSEHNLQNITVTAEEGGRFLALAGGFFEGLVVHIVSVWTDPVARGQGVAAQLVAMVMDWARGSGARRIILEVTEGNDTAYRVYERLGFRPTGVLHPLRPGATLKTREMALDVPLEAPARMQDLLNERPPDRRQNATGVIVRDGRVFVMRRSASRTFLPNAWDLPGGHVEPMESIGDGLVREVFEETGWRVARVVRGLGTIQTEVEGLVHREHCFEVEVACDLDSPVLETDKFSESRWIGLADLDVAREARAADDRQLVELIQRALG